MSEAAGATPLVPARLVRGLRGAVASPHFLASEAGLGVLRAGGSAVDAAIATNAGLSVVTPYVCGLGGDAFWLIWDGAQVHGLNGSGAAAAGATLAAAAGAGLVEMPPIGPWTVTVPGAIHSWGEAHRRFGRLPWATLLEPAIELADGFVATPGWCAAIERSAEVFGSDGDWARTFRPVGRPWRVGEKVTLPVMAATLRRLADEGPAIVYDGPLARRAVEYLAARGSPLRAADFAAHRSDWTTPIGIGYRGHTSLSHPPNSSGATALQLLGLLERFTPSHNDARWIHLGLQAAEIALADRAMHLTDSRMMARDAVEKLLASDRLDSLAASMTEQPIKRRLTATASVGDTVYLATADGSGNLVSLIESNYRGFGSGLVDPQTGIAYQNRGASFNLDPRHVNVLAPGKRPLHTLTPGMLLREGRPWIAHGSMGGAIQPMVFAQFVSAIVDGGLDIAAALAAPRWSLGAPYPDADPHAAYLESRYAPGIAGELERLGHARTLIEPFSTAMGHAHAVEVVDGPDAETGRSLAAASDPRSEGAALAW